MSTGLRLIIISLEYSFWTNLKCWTTSCLLNHIQGKKRKLGEWIFFILVDICIMKYFFYYFSLVLDKRFECYNKIKSLVFQIKYLQCELAEAKAALWNGKKIFKKWKIRNSKSVSVQRQWRDISNVLCVHAAGPRAYNYLYVKCFSGHTSALVPKS